MNRTNTLLLLKRPRIWIIFILGFCSGLPIALTASTLQAWLTVTGASIVSIGLFNLVSLPYLYKFLWAPFLDRFSLLGLGRRRGWILLMQVGLIITIFFMGHTNPTTSLTLLAVLALITALFSATQDMAIDAYRTDVLLPEERGLGSAVTIGGWRVGALLSGGVALILAQHIGWKITYIIMAMCLIVGIITTFFAPEPPITKNTPTSLSTAIIEPIREFLSRRYAIAILLFILVYKFSDAFALSLMSTFLLRGIGFSLVTVGSVFKIFGVFAILFGVFLGGLLIPRWGLFKSLLIFGILQAVTNLMFLALAIVGKSYMLLVISIVVENIAGGMGTAAALALLMGLCDKRYTATQFALLSAIASIGRVVLGSVSGWIVQATGWPLFFIISVLLMIPGIVFLCFLKNRVSFNANSIRAT